MAVDMTKPPKRVLVEVTHQVWVDVVEHGQNGAPLAVSQAEAARIVRQDIEAQDWGGYSRLGNALRGLNPWQATHIRVAREQVARPTESDRLNGRGA
jgi:hypothetical protein